MFVFVREGVAAFSFLGGKGPRFQNSKKEQRARFKIFVDARLPARF